MATNAERRTTPIGLVQVYPADADDNVHMDVDIIAIHGLDTRSPDTWTWKAPGDRTRQVNWLQDLNMLPSCVGQARIFTCDWPAEMFQKSIPTTLEESADFLLHALKQHLEKKDHLGKNRPLLFVASCLGGIVLIKALDIDSKRPGPSVSMATRGLVFLATPFLGTSFKDMPGPTMRVWESLNDQTVSALIDYTKEPPSGLDELVRHFIDLKQERRLHVFTFWESHQTSLLGRVHLASAFSGRMIVPWLAVLFSCYFFSLSLLPWLLTIFLCWWPGYHLYQPKQLVDKRSATAQILECQRLNRSHVLMNKFRSPDCHDYTKVAGKTKEILRKIREGTPLNQADAWIRDNYYTRERLKIDRLSGDPLPLDQCYINLAIVQQSSLNVGGPNKSDSRSSPFSLFARQKVEIPDAALQIQLSSIFAERQGPRGSSPLKPRRILIRGRPGVGKTTLCKKIVYEFMRGSWPEWNQIFDRILWVPLRNLKLEERHREPAYDLRRLFLHEYFALPSNRPDLAEELARAVSKDNGKTLFLLDGLDEVSDYRIGNGSMCRFLNELLNQSSVIITSRPSAAAVPRVDLELETIGFLPDQVNAYVKRTFTNLDTGEVYWRKTEAVRLFLESHWLIQGLVRIPIQLDAFCYTWDDFDPEGVPNTMTGMYRAIEQKLWKKDAVRLQKLSEFQALSARPAEIKKKVKDELLILECLAFNGMCGDVISFSPAHRDEMIGWLPIELQDTLDDTLSKLSFVRTSDPSTRKENREYHFIHLTFQEYFAARYFVRRWMAGESLHYAFSNLQLHFAPADPVDFIRCHKYTPRLDVMWRFVAGILDTEYDDKNIELFRIMGEEPLDLLGTSHQRLIIHCPNEVFHNLSCRGELHKKLSEWLLVEDRLRVKRSMALEMEFPEELLISLLLKERNASKRFLQLLSFRAMLSPGAMATIAKLIKDVDGSVRRAAAEALGRQSSLSNEILGSIADCLRDEDGSVRRAAVEALRRHSSLPHEILDGIADYLKDEDKSVQKAAVEALGHQLSLPYETLKSIADYLKDEDGSVRRAAVEALRRHSSLPHEILDGIADYLKDEDKSVQKAAVEALERQSLSNEILGDIADCLKDKNESVRQTAVEALERQSLLPHELLDGIADCLRDKDKSVRKAAVQALGRQPSLPYEILNGIADCLRDKDGSVRWAAVQALGRQVSLPYGILDGIADYLKDKNGSVRWVAIEALGDQPSLSYEILDNITDCLKDKDEFVRWAAVKVLGRQSSLSHKVLDDITDCLKDKNGLVRWAAVKALRRQSSLPHMILDGTADSLKDEDEDESILMEAFKALQSHDYPSKASIGERPDRSLISDVSLMAYALQFKGNYDERALRILRTRPVLPSDTVNILVMLLQDENTDVCWRAFGALRSHPTLYYNLLCGQSAHQFYEMALKESFHSQQSWYVYKGQFYVTTPEKTTATPIQQEIDFSVFAKGLHLPTI